VDRGTSHAAVRIPTGGVAASFAAGLLAFVGCIAGLAFSPADGFWINDCGNKALMAERLVDSHYRALAFDYPAATVDPTRAAFPILPPFAVVRDGRLLSIYPPAYPAIGAPLLRVFGYDGLRIPAALGVAIAAAMLCTWLTPAVGRRLAFAAAAVLALGTPLFFYGVTVWEHSLTVALSLIAWCLAERGRPAQIFAAGATLALGCFLRLELGLMGVALAVALVVRTRRLAPPLRLAAGAVGPIAALLLLHLALYGSLLGPHLESTDTGLAAASGFRAETAFGAVRVMVGLLAGFGTSDREAWLLGVAALAAPIVGWAAARRGRSDAVALVGLCFVGLAVWLWGTGRVFTAARPLEMLVRYNGLLVQLPMFALAGFGAERVFRRPELAGIRLGVLAGSSFLGLVVLAGAATGSGYGVQAGFGVHWGPRVLLPAIPALVALAVAAVWSGPEDEAWTRRVRSSAAVALGLAGLLSTALAVDLLHAQKTDAHRFQARLRAQPERYVLTTHPLLAQQLAPLWHERPMLLARDPRSLAVVVNGLRAAEVRRFTFVAPAGAPLLSGVGGLHCRIAERYRGERTHYLDLDIQRCALGRSGDAGRSGSRSGGDRSHPLKRRRPAAQ